MYWRESVQKTSSDRIESKQQFGSTLIKRMYQQEWWPRLALEYEPTNQSNIKAERLETRAIWAHLRVNLKSVVLFDHNLCLLTMFSVLMDSRHILSFIIANKIVKKWKVKKKSVKQKKLQFPQESVLCHISLKFLLIHEFEMSTWK